MLPLSATPLSGQSGLTRNTSGGFMAWLRWDAVTWLPSDSCLNPLSAPLTSAFHAGGVPSEFNLFLASLLVLRLPVPTLNLNPAIAVGFWTLLPGARARCPIRASRSRAARPQMERPCRHAASY